MSILTFHLAAIQTKYFLLDVLFKCWHRTDVNRALRLLQGEFMSGFSMPSFRAYVLDPKRGSQTVLFSGHKQVTAVKTPSIIPCLTNQRPDLISEELKWQLESESAAHWKYQCTSKSSKKFTNQLVKSARPPSNVFRTLYWNIAAANVCGA